MTMVRRLIPDEPRYESAHSLPDQCRSRFQRASA